MTAKNISFILKKPSLLNIGLGLWCLTPLSTIIQLYQSNVLVEKWGILRMHLF